ncbi:MAG: hypothetical protein WCF23_16495 [Candidatus Nitrosopolaris sp.]
MTTAIDQIEKQDKNKGVRIFFDNSEVGYVYIEYFYNNVHYCDVEDCPTLGNIEKEESSLSTDVYAAYVTFCVRRGSRPKEMSVFGKKLADQGIYNMRHPDHGDRDRYYDGIRLLTDMRGLNQTTID